MLSFAPDKKTEKNLLQLQAQLVESWNIISGLPAAETDYIRRQALISTIGASTRIENAVLTDQEIEWVDTTLSLDDRTTAFESHKDFIIAKLSKDRQRSIEEVAGCREMLTTIYQQARSIIPLSETHIRALHHDLLRYYPKAADYAGEYKNSPNKVFSFNHETGRQATVLDPADPGVMTRTSMAELIAWYNVAIQDSTWPLLAAVEFVFRFLAIHPFQDGNGRLGRGLFLLALLQSDDKYLRGVIPYIAIDRQVERNKARYYKVLHQSSQGKFHQDPTQYNYIPLAHFFIKIIAQSLDDIAMYRSRYANIQTLSASAHTVLHCFKINPEKTLQVAEIEKQTDLPRRTIQYTLKTLTEKGFLHRLGRGAGSRYQLIF